MKLLLCHHCQDVFKFGRKEFKYCNCGKLKGRYIDDLNAEFYSEDDGYSLIGFANSSLSSSIREYNIKKEIEPYKEGDLGIRFEAFIIPEPCPTIKKVY